MEGSRCVNKYPEDSGSYMARIVQPGINSDNGSYNGKYGFQSFKGTCLFRIMRIFF